MHMYCTLGYDWRQSWGILRVLRTTSEQTDDLRKLLVSRKYHFAPVGSALIRAWKPDRQTGPGLFSHSRLSVGNKQSVMGASST